MVITESAVNVTAMPTDRTRIEQIVPAEHNDDSSHDVKNREGDRSAISALASSRYSSGPLLRPFQRQHYGPSRPLQVTNNARRTRVSSASQ
jgi:hypothetical protein